MKRIVVCCDGTWKRVDSPCPTNVARLAQAVLPCAPDGTEQALIHLDGVGTGRGTGPLARGFDRLAGGMFGQGLLATLAEAYRFLALNYAPGDQIFLFGFSRGAYTARSLAGLIRNCGIPSRRNAHNISHAIARYRRRGPAELPDSPKNLTFRADFTPEVVTSAAELEWRQAHYPEQETTLLRIAYLGVWDTVGALGVPAHLRIAGLLNQRHGFHDTRLSSIVLAARHAVAVDEKRRCFPPALWDNIDELNAGLHDPERPRYRQVWFPGDHSAVGGGSGASDLSNDPLLWILEGAVEAGLAVDPDQLARIASGRNCLGEFDAARRRRLVKAVLSQGGRARPGPRRVGDLAPAAVLRWKADPRYRPKPLSEVSDLLEASPVAVIGGRDDTRK